MVKQYNAKFRVGQGGVKVIAPDNPIGPVTLGEGEDQLVLVDTTNSGAIAITLQRADGSGGKRLCIKKIAGTAAVTITPAFSQTIDGKTSVSLVGVNEALDIVSDNENWLKSVVAGGWQLLEAFTSTFSDDTKDFNLSPAFDGDDNSMLVLIIDSSWAGIDNIPLRINNIGLANYFTYGSSIKAGVETLINIASAGFFTLATSALVSAANDVLHAIVYIQINKAGPNDRVGFQSFANGLTVKGREVLSGTLDQNVSSISRISLESNADFQVGTRMTLYKVARG